MINKNKKVCMVVGNNFTHDARVSKEAQSLSKAGYDVVVYALSSTGLPPFEKQGQVVVKRLPIINYSPIHIKFWRAYTQFYKALREIFAERADVYHAHDADTLLICYFAAKGNGTKLVYDFHEYWREKTPWHNSFLGRIWEKIENKILVSIEYLIAPCADALITVNDSLASEFKDHNKVKEKPTVLYNVPYFSSPSDRDRMLLREKIRAGSEDRLILFLGAFSKHRGLENLIESLTYLSLNFKLVFLGYGRMVEWLKKLGAAYPNRFFVLDPVSPEDVTKWASGADVGVAPIQNASWSYFHSSPNKIFEYLMAGLPIACSDFPEMGRIILENKVGKTFNPEEPKDIARAIKEIFSNASTYMKMKENTARAAREKYNWEVEERKLISLYKRL